MDAATHEALSGIRSAITDMKAEASEFRRDFNVHVTEDQAMRSQIDKWTGNIQVILWLVGIGVPVMVTLLIWIAKHLVPIS